MVIFSCEKSIVIVNCSNCYPEEPTSTTIEVKLEFLVESNAIIKVYEGNLEDGLIIASENVHAEYWEYEADLNKKYTFTATYISDGKTYITVDAIFPRVKYEKELCENPCYFIYDRKVNLRLKYPTI